MGVGYESMEAYRHGYASGYLVPMRDSVGVGLSEA